MRRCEITLTSEENGWTVEQVMTRTLRLSKTKRKRAKFFPGGILLDGRSARTTERVMAGQRLTVTVPEREEGAVVPTEGEVAILYEDEWLLVADKPAGMSVHPGPGHYTDTLGNYLAWHYRSLGQPFVLRLVNRLDKGTSGLLVAAKSAEAHERLTALLHTGGFVRRYLAVCQGGPPEMEGTVTLPIGKRPNTLNEYEVRPDGLPAETSYRVLEQKGEHTLLSLTLHTGRTHQIRVHMAALGCPLAGDAVYGSGGAPGRPALHSCLIELCHPFTGKPLRWESALPRELAAFWDSAQ